MNHLMPKIENSLFYLLLFFLPTQLGKHFWPEFSFVAGLRVDYLSPTLYLTDLLVVLLILCWGVRQIQSMVPKKQKIKLSRGFVLYLCFSSFLLLTVLLSGNQLSGVYHLVKFFEFSFIAYYIASTVARVQQIKPIVLILSGGIIFESVLSVLQSLTQSSLGGLWYFFGERTFSSTTPGIANATINGALLLRPYGTFSHPNVLAGFLLASLSLVLFSVMHHRWQKMKFVLFAILLVGTVALVLTLSRISIALWVIILFFSLVTQLQRIVSNTNGWLLLSSGSLLLFVVVFFSPVLPRFFQTSLLEESVTQREFLIQAALSQSLLHPFFGVGFGNFLPAFGTIHHGFSFGTLLQPVHNIFLLMLAETGIIGLAFFLWFVFQTYHRLFHILHTTKEPWYRFQIILLSLVLIIGFFDHYFLTIQQGQLLLALVIGFSWITFHEK